MSSRDDSSGSTGSEEPPAPAMNPKLPYSRALAVLEPDAIVERLTDDITINVAVHDDPLHGKDVARFLFGVLQQELAPITITEELVDGDTAVILFDTAIGGITAHGLNIIHHTETGDIDQLTVFFRPLQALTAVAETVGAHMARQFGQRPDTLDS